MRGFDLPQLHQPPFDTLSEPQRSHLQQHSNIVYLDNLQPIPTDWQGDFFIILKGQVHQLQDEGLIASLNANDWFDTTPKQGDVFCFITQQQSLLYCINHFNLIVARIEQAQSLEDVAVAVALIGKFIREQHTSGVKTQVISRMVQSLNLQVFAKVWQLIVPALTLTFYNTCLIVMGSEGRGEQILRTDQDNALIIHNGFKDDNLPTYAMQFNDALATMGYPYCEGGITLNNERWRKTLTAFEKQITTWYTSGHTEDMMWIATLMDAHSVCGDIKLLQQLQQHWQVTAKNLATSNFINRFAKPILQFDAQRSKLPNEWVSLDLEMTGLNPKQDHILSVGAVVIRQAQTGFVIDTDSALSMVCRLPVMPSHDTIVIHGLRPVDVANGVSYDDMLSQLLPLIKNRTLVGFCVDMDVAFFNAIIKPFLGVRLPNAVIDVSRL